MPRFFYDGYAVLGYLSDNPKYRYYFEENDGILTKLNLMEIYYRTLEVHGSRAAFHVITVFSRYLMDFDIGDIRASMRIRLRLKKRGLDVSYADALGYHIASKSKIKFLTGDRWFKGLKGVEFVP